MNAKIVCVYDEGAIVNTSLIGATGLSILIDVDGQKTLFDTGMRGRYLMDNLNRLDIDPESIDRVVISHLHKSNVGGLSKLLEERKKPLEVYADPLLLHKKKTIGGKIIGEEAASKMNFHELNGDTELSRHLSTIGPTGPSNESFLLLRTIDGAVVFSSCYHDGTAVVMAAAKEKTGRNPYALIGGIHLPKVKQSDVDPTADILEEYGTPKLYLDHCAAPLGLTFLRVRFGLDGVKEFYVGTKLQFDV